MAGRIINHALRIAWNGVNLINESANMVRAAGSFSFGPPFSYLLGSTGIVDSATFTIRMPDATKLAQILAGASLGGHIEFDVATAPDSAATSFQRVFTGVVQGVTVRPPSGKNSGDVQIQASTIDGDLLQTKVSTPQDVFAHYYHNFGNEEEYIRHILQRAGQYSVPRHFSNGMVKMNWLWTDDEPALEEIWEVCAATGGRFYTDRNGEYRFDSAAKMASIPTGGIENLHADEYRSIDITVSTQGIYSGVSVEASPRMLGELDTQWEPTEGEDVTIPAGESKTFTCRYRHPLVYITSLEWGAVNSGGVDHTGYRPVPGGPTAVELIKATHYAQRSELTFRNNLGATLYLSGFKIIGMPAIGGPTMEVRVQSDEPYWSTRNKRDRSFRGNPYVQTKEHARFLAEQLSDVADTPLTKVNITGAIAKANRQCGDILAVEAPALWATPKEVIVHEIRWRYERLFEQDLTGYLRQELYPNAPYFVIGQDVLCSERRVFY